MGGGVGGTLMVAGLSPAVRSQLLAGWSRRPQMGSRLSFIVCIIFSRSLDGACSDAGGKIPSEKIETLRLIEAWS